MTPLSCDVVKKDNYYEGSVDVFGKGVFNIRARKLETLKGLLPHRLSKFITEEFGIDGKAQAA